MRRLQATWRAWRVFRNAWPALTQDVAVDWDQADRAKLKTFLASAEGARLRVLLRVAVQQKDSEAVARQQCGDFDRGVALGFRTALAYLISLSVPSAPQKQEEPEFVLPGAQHDLEKRWTP